ncbi:uracil-DNA glycosylase [Bacillus tianshenii]|nr:uracil-DNA glycosylase [Bacillus tianshenii]
MKRTNHQNKRINCFKCKYFQTTWNPQFPRACKAYGFKTKQMPSDYVFHASGKQCQLFEEKHVGGKR